MNENEQQAPVAQTIPEIQPAQTGSTVKEELTHPHVENPAPQGDEGDAGTPAEDVVEDTPVEDAPVQDTPAVDDVPSAPDAPVYDGEHFKQLMGEAKYEPTEMDITFIDEYGNFDAEKFGAFMRANNENIFNQANNATLAKVEAQRIEQDLWASVHTDFPEIKENTTLDKSLRGARLQDILSGGDGDLHRLAKDIVGPIRESKIAAVESVNRKVSKQEALTAATPNTATPEKTAPDLMTQLNTANAKGDRELANRIRHAIRKERIYGKSE